MARKKTEGGPPRESIVLDQPLTQILSERYLSYALSTIMARSLPDVRDGLKPVHRRLLFAMDQLKLNPEHGPKKSARVVGDVIGKYHPHGDQSVYDALVRLAQDFAVRYPLVDGQGNFGNIDGDNAAAMRYTEARLTQTSVLLLEGINEDAIDFRPTYDGEGQEPIVMPSNFPNLLANGASGIAVGMATNIPPHNVAELCDAMLMMLEDKDATVEDLLKVVKGPDFPTGGILVETKASIIESYKTGRGSFRLRARWKQEDLKNGGYQIIVTEIPYQVQKSRLIEKLADLIQNKKLPMLDDVRDESAEDIRLVLVPKSRNIDPNLLMETLFRNCDLETRFSLNMNVLDKGVTPRVMNLKEVLQAWLAHRQEVLIRRSNFRLGQVMHRIEVLDGYMIVYLNIDKVIKIIRTEDEPKPKLMKAFGLTEVQAEAILNMRLRSLRKLEEMELQKEHDSLSKERDALQALLKSEARQWTAIKKQIGAIHDLYGPSTKIGKRRTEIGKAPSLAAIETLAEALTVMEKEPITLILSAKGWIKALKGHDNDKEQSYKEGDKGRFSVEGYTTDKFVLFATNGRFYSLSGDKLPSGRGFGEPVRLMIDLPNDADVLQVMVYNPDLKFLVATDEGHGFIVPSSEILAQTKNGKQILNVGNNSEANICKVVDPSHDHIATIGTNRKMLVFKLKEIPEMSKGKGVILQKIKDGTLADAKTFKMKDGLTYITAGSEKKVGDIKPWVGERAQAGKLPPNGFPKSPKFD